ncbi:MAG: DNA adenine methylase [Deltaproteobacteria bacterium]|nr:DNA adenine methylase [Deltaproteobacteria bacterium]
MPFLSPLRYPGGKRRLTNFVKLVFHNNNLLDGEYAEPYAGGAGVALALLFDEYVRRIHINDLDYSVYAFWYSVLNETESLCQLINDTPVTIDEWHRQKEIHNDTEVSLLELGFSTFFLNRTNRSGIISGGVIGGKNQTGEWKLDARYNKRNLVDRIKKVARYRKRISLYNLDASIFIRETIPQLSNQTLIYLDPPYFVKGQQLLYTNFYKPDDHKTVAGLVHSIQQSWIVSYDDVPEIRNLYNGFQHLDYGLRYSAQDRYRGSEIMFFCHGLEIPEVANPAKIKKNAFQRYLL